MPDFERHKAIYAALSSAGLHDLIPCRWCCEDCEGCDTAEMLRIVCIEQTGERRVPFTTAVGDITLGFSPRGAIPYPDAAQALLARRTKETNG
jgi:hypothetical protein